MKKKTIIILILIAMLVSNGVANTNAATQSEIDQAIQDGLEWLASQQTYPPGMIGYEYFLGTTAAAVLAFENEGHFPGGTTDYADVVEKGFEFIFDRCRKIPITPQVHGNPDTDGDWQGIYFRGYTGGRVVYETGMVMQAIVASHSPDRVVTKGYCSGLTYQEILTDAVDWVAWAQMDAGPGRGGWRYSAYNNYEGVSDNSVSQWPVLGLIAAEQWGIYAPQFVKDELEIWVNYIQCQDDECNPDEVGGSGYSTPDSLVNISKTGGLLVEFYYLGDDKNTPRVQNAISFINSRWNDPPYNQWYGNRRHPYAMFSVFKGLELMEVTEIPSAPANDDTPAGDWWGDYSEYLVITQKPGGFWYGYYGRWKEWISTSWYIVILQATIFPLEVGLELPDCACDEGGYDVTINYSVKRFEVDGELKVYKDGSLHDTLTLTDFIGFDTWTFTVEDDTPGSHVWRAVLEVIGGGKTFATEDSNSLNVCETPQVSGIPDQVAPFETFDLDDYLAYSGSHNVTWSASWVPTEWTVTIDPDNTVTVTFPDGAQDPVDITFTASIDCCDSVTCSSSDVANFVPNQPPEVVAGGPYSGDEGSPIALDGALASDPDDDPLAYSWSVDSTLCTFEDASILNPEITCGDNGSFTVTITVSDGVNDPVSSSTTVTVNNVAPTVTSVTVPIDPVSIDNSASASGTFTDPAGTNDELYTCTVNYGDAPSEQPGTVSGIECLGPVHFYNEPGVYNVIVTVTDKDGDSGSLEAAAMIVIYDPEGGFVTGGGWFISPQGACHFDACTDETIGKASFGFVSKYKKGANVPTGNTEFQFKAGNLNFHSDTYQWLVVNQNSTNAQFKGSGTINGEISQTGEYKFMIWATDGEPDTFRIKIWWEDINEIETVVYDNNVEDVEEFGQPISKGNILVHK